eukprot:3691170-Heterocapsa_arctica.AAC.1
MGTPPSRPSQAPPSDGDPGAFDPLLPLPSSPVPFRSRAVVISRLPLPTGDSRPTHASPLYSGRRWGPPRGDPGAVGLPFPSCPPLPSPGLPLPSALRSLRFRVLPPPFL